MTTIINELQAKYISHFITKESEMSVVDAKVFLELLRNDMQAEFRDDRIKSLERYLVDVDRGELAKAAWEAKWKAAAYEYIALTERWESLGATWRNTEALTKWEYEGIEFYRVWSRTLITENIIEARIADARLTEMVAQKEAPQ